MNSQLLAYITLYVLVHTEGGQEFPIHLFTLCYHKFQQLPNIMLSVFGMYLTYIQDIYCTVLHTLSNGINIVISGYLRKMKCFAQRRALFSLDVFQNYKSTAKNNGSKETEIKWNSPNFLTFKEPRNRFQGISSASLCSLAGRYDNPIPTRFLAPIDCLKIPAQD